MTAPIYAIGDIHGQIDFLQGALDLIERDGGPDAQVVFIGDLVDRGPASRAVIEHLMNGQAQGRNWTVIKGNHDRMFEWFLQDEPRHDPYLLVGYHWLHDRIGGMETLASYGVAVQDRERLSSVHRRALEAVPDRHKSYLASLPFFHLQGDVMFVHAGLTPSVAFSDQHENELIWTRGGAFERHTDPYPWMLVHGHTPQDKPTHFGNRINIDVGQVMAAHWCLS